MAPNLRLPTADMHTLDKKTLGQSPTGPQCAPRLKTQGRGIMGEMMQGSLAENQIDAPLFEPGQIKRIARLILQVQCLAFRVRIPNGIPGLRIPINRDDFRLRETASQTDRQISRPQASSTTRFPERSSRQSSV
jgi:hypothetical protein